MGAVIEKFGRSIGRITPGHPALSRAMLLAGFRAYGGKLHLAPNRKLPPSRRMAATELNRVIRQTLAKTDRTALVSIFMPCELLQAMDILPMCAEMYSTFLNGAWAESVFSETAEAEGIAETFCSYHKILLGSAFAGVLRSPAMVVNTSLVCDANNLTFRTLAEYYKIPQYYVDVPGAQTEDSVQYVAEQLRELAQFLQDHTGRLLKEEKLRAAVARSAETVRLLRACREEKSRHSLPGDVASELYEIYLVHNALGTEKSLSYARSLLHDLQQAPPAHGIRLLWIHTIPNWQKPVTGLVNFSDRCQIVACDINLEGLVDMDPRKPYESMARRLVMSGYNGGRTRVRAAVEQAKALQVDGVICFCHWGCKQTMGLSAVFKEELEKAGFPTLILNGDGCDRRNASDGQVATRLGAFLEMLERTKSRG